MIKMTWEETKYLAILIFFLFMTTLFAIPNGLNLRVQRDSYMVLSILLCGGLWVILKDKIIGAFLVYCVIVAIVKGIEVQTIVFLMAYISLYIALLNYKVNKERIYDFFIFIACANLAFQLAQYFGWSWNALASQNFYLGLMANRNETSALYAVTAAACLRKDRYLFLIVNILGLMLSVSLGGVLAFSAIMVLWIIRNTHRIPVIRAGKYPSVKWAIPIGAIAMVLSFIIFYGTVIHPFNIEHRQNERFFAWKQTAKVAMLQKMGWGWGQYQVVMPLINSWKYINEDSRKMLIIAVRDKPKFIKAIQLISGNDPNIFEGNKMQREVFVEAHNEYIEFLFTAGWIGLIFMLVLISHVVIHSYKNIDPVPFYGILASCGTAMTFFSWHIVPLVVITMFYVAWAKGDNAHSI
jgi:hypothetical protein